MRSGGKAVLPDAGVFVEEAVAAEAADSPCCGWNGGIFLGIMIRRAVKSATNATRCIAGRDRHGEAVTTHWQCVVASDTKFPWRQR